MTDREKQIEEMENDICNACKPRVAKCKCNFPCTMCGIVATELVKKYQPKIPEGAVVLTKEEKQEYENLKKLLIYDKPIKSRVYEFIKDVKERERKETAREIYYKAEKKAYFKDGGYYDKDRYYLDMEDLKEILKQFGIEIKE